MQIHILDGQEQLGPFTADELKKKIEAGECNAETQAWHVGLPEWSSLQKVAPEFFKTSAEVNLQPVANPPSLPPQIKEIKAARAWYDYNLVIVPAMLMCYPAGLLPLWLTKRYSRDVKIGLSVAIPLGYYAYLLIFLHLLTGAAESRRSDIIYYPQETSTLANTRQANTKPNLSNQSRDKMEATMEREAVKIASKVFGGRIYVLGAEAAMYSEEAGGRFPLVIYITRDYLDVFQNLGSQQTKEEFVFSDLKKFFGLVKTSSAFSGVKNVFLTFGAKEFYDVYHVVGYPVPAGILEFMLPMPIIQNTDWESMSNAEIEQLIKEQGHFKVYRD